MGTAVGIGIGIGRKRKNWSSYWTTLFKAYKQRVETDGGTIINTTRMSQDVKFLEECGEFDSLVMFESAWGGVKKTTSGGVSLIDKLYDLKEKDAVQATAENKPYWGYVNGNTSQPVIDFHYAANAVRKLTHSSMLTNDYTAIYIHKPFTNSGSRVIHAGNITGGKLGVCARSATAGRGTGLFDGTNLRFSNENPIKEEWRADTYQPAKIFKNGVEVTYDVTANITKGELTTIGQRGDAISTPYFGDVAAIIVFNKTISDEIRISIENYFKAKVIDTYSSMTFSQISYRVIHSRGNQIFGVNDSDGKLLYSTNNGTSFTEMVFADTANIQFGHIFPNGTIYICTKTKIYKSTDDLLSLIEITARKINGSVFVPGGPPSSPFEPIHIIDEQVLPDGKTMICWGNYTLSGNDIVAVFSSIDGETCQMEYAFTSGGYTGDYAARHLHAVSFCEDDGKWYVSTGDANAKGELHHLAGTYGTPWTWEYLFAGDDSLRTKAVGTSFKNGKIYFASDATNNPAITELGVFYSDIATFSTLTSHQTLFNLPTEVGMMYMDDDKIIITKLRDTTSYYVYVFDLNCGVLDVHVVDVIATTVLMVHKQSTNKYILNVFGDQSNSFVLTL